MSPLVDIVRVEENTTSIAARRGLRRIDEVFEGAVEFAGFESSIYVSEEQSVVTGGRDPSAAAVLLLNDEGPAIGVGCVGEYGVAICILSRGEGTWRGVFLVVVVPDLVLCALFRYRPADFHVCYPHRGEDVLLCVILVTRPTHCFDYLSQYLVADIGIFSLPPRLEVEGSSQPLLDHLLHWNRGQVAAIVVSHKSAGVDAGVAGALPGVPVIVRRVSGYISVPTSSVM